MCIVQDYHHHLECGSVFHVLFHGLYLEGIFFPMGMAFYKPQGIPMTHVAPIDKENEAHLLNRGKSFRSAFTKNASLPIGHGLNCCKLLPSWLPPLYINTWMHSTWSYLLDDPNIYDWVNRDEQNTINFYDSVYLEPNIV